MSPSRSEIESILSQGKRICIIGTGGFGREVLCCLMEVIKHYGLRIEDIACFMVSDEDYKDTSVMGLPIYRRSTFDPALFAVVVAVGNPQIRKRAVENFPANTQYVTVIHPTAILSDWVELGEGSIVTAGTILTCAIKIGKHAQLNLHTTIGHDCIIGDYFTTAPAANISGNCTIGECVYFGTNAAVRQGINICSNVTIGMGAIVVKPITTPGVYVGVPAHPLEKNKNKV